MDYVLTLPGFETHRITLQTGTFFSAARLTIDGDPAPKGRKRGTYTLRRSDGSEAVAQLRTINVVDPIPQLIIDGEKILIAPPLKWYESVWLALPILLALAGGFLGGLFGAIAAVLNGRIFRSELRGMVKYGLTGAVSLAVGASYFVAAMLVSWAINGGSASALQEFRSETGGFSVMVPAALKEQVRSLDTAAGLIEMHMFSGQLNQGSIAIAYADYPPDVLQAQSTDELLDGSRNGAVANSGGALLSEKKITLDGHPGRDLTVQGQAKNGRKVLLRSRLFLVGNRLYQVICEAAPGQETEAAAESFLNSFKLLAP